VESTRLSAGVLYPEVDRPNMGYHHVDPDTPEQWDGRPVDVRSIRAVAGLDYQDASPGMRVYEADPGEQFPLSYHSNDEQVEAFPLLDGELHAQTPDGELVVGADEALLIEPGSPQRAFNPASTRGSVCAPGVGAPSVDDARTYEPARH
jgi:mannose-6-phosphate isomerase-like protein (cupin superfamily)